MRISSEDADRQTPHPGGKARVPGVRRRCIGPALLYNPPERHVDRLVFVEDEIIPGRAFRRVLPYAIRKGDPALPEPG